MSRPEMTVDNYKRVYAYYEQVEPSVRFSKLVFGALDKALRPRVIHADHAMSDITRAKRSNMPHIYVLNHLSHLDTFAPVAAVNQILHDELGNVRLLGADFHSSNIYGPLADKIGFIPVHRRKEYADIPHLSSAHHAMFVCATRLLARHQTIVLAPEGDSNYGDQTKLMPLGLGVGKIAQMSAITMNSPIAITPFGASTGNSGKATNANICVGRTVFADSSMAVADIISETHDRLESAVAVARELY